VIWNSYLPAILGSFLGGYFLILSREGPLAEDQNGNHSNGSGCGAPPGFLLDFFLLLIREKAGCQDKIMFDKFALTGRG
jgi:hypothetical protein